mmetsp:Transcript_4136/g.9416  ORF Transcript_4136/g.9416 Transcript_4136/m.9416 type:complete len:226 (-) Transcript_4136:22-699(-)
MRPAEPLPDDSRPALRLSVPTESGRKHGISRGHPGPAHSPLGSPASSALPPSDSFSLCCFSRRLLAATISERSILCPGILTPCISKEFWINVRTCDCSMCASSPSTWCSAKTRSTSFCTSSSFSEITLRTKFLTSSLSSVPLPSSSMSLRAAAFIIVTLSISSLDILPSEFLSAAVSILWTTILPTSVLKCLSIALWTSSAVRYPLSPSSRSSKHPSWYQIALLM